MNRKKIVLIACCTALTLLQYGCGGKKKTEASSGDVKQVETTAQVTTPDQAVSAPAPKEIVCVWDGVPLRDKPVKAGKYLSSIALGEVLTDLNETQLDATDKNREYFKIRLSDGKEGWAPTYGLVRNSSVGVVKSDATICKRPDLLTITNVILKPRELVAVTSTKDEWAEITNEQKKTTGWIKKDALSTNKEDITASILINKKLAAKDNKSTIEKYKAIIAETPFPNSIFIESMKKDLEALESAEAPKTEAVPAQENTESTGTDNTGSESTPPASE